MRCSFNVRCAPSKLGKSQCRPMHHFLARHRTEQALALHVYAVAHRRKQPRNYVQLIFAYIHRLITILDSYFESTLLHFHNHLQYQFLWYESRKPELEVTVPAFDIHVLLQATIYRV